MEKIYRVTCPCCDKPLHIEMKLSDDGEICVGLFHYITEASYDEIRAKGFEFGIEEGCEEDEQR